MRSALIVALLGTVMSVGAWAKDTAHLGVMLGTIEDAPQRGFEGRGAYVRDVMEDGPAHEAGVRKGDIIVAMDKEAVIGPGHLRDLLDSRRPGDEVTLTVWRKGKKLDLKVRLGRRPPPVPELGQLSKTIVIRGEPRAWLGVRTQELSEQLGAHFGAKAGVLVSEVMKDSPAAEAGIQAGDVIAKVDDEAVDHPFELTRILGEHEPGDKVTLALVRDGKELKKEATLRETPKKCRRGLPQVFSWTDEGRPLDLRGLADLPFIRHLEGLGEPSVGIEELRDEVRALRERLDDEMRALRAELEELKRSLEHTD